MYDSIIGKDFTINPGKELTNTIISYSGEINRDFLSVRKIYIDFRKKK